MSFIVTFEDFTPSERHDGQPWLQVRVEESESRDGPFAEIDVFDLDPVDTDPAEPQPRDFTTSNASLEEGWYRIVFVDAIGDEQPLEPLRYSTVRTSFTPAVGAVAALIRSRTVDDNGNELGTFTSATRPTRKQVEGLIDKAAGKVTQRIGDTIAPALWGAASETIALRTAMLVELGYFADQIRADRSPYVELKALYDESFKDLVAAWEDLGDDEEPGTGDDLSVGLPVYEFPRADIGRACW